MDYGGLSGKKWPLVLRIIVLVHFSLICAYCCCRIFLQRSQLVNKGATSMAVTPFVTSQGPLKKRVVCEIVRADHGAGWRRWEVGSWSAGEVYQRGLTASWTASWTFALKVSSPAFPSPKSSCVLEMWVPLIFLALRDFSENIALRE